MSHLKVGRLELSTRNNYKINGKNAKRCFLLSEKSDKNLILINTPKEYESSDKYILYDNNTKTIVNLLGSVGNREDDKSIYYYLFTYKWLSHKKYNLLFDFILQNNYDICSSRIIYTKEIITVDPPDSLDLDDGFSIEEDDEYYYLDIHIADPISYFDLSHEFIKPIFDELINRISTCYIPHNNKINNLLPEEFVKKVTLIGENKRTILFKTIINKINNKIDFKIIFTIATTKINNFSYQNFDKYLSHNLSFKNTLVSVTNILIKNMYNHQNTFSNLLSHEDNELSHKFIENIMIWINFKTGNFLSSFSPKSIIRIQNIPENISHEIQQIKSKDYSLFESIQNIIKSPASYEFSSHENNLHHSLGLNFYSHISSPMRRFVDMYNHIIIHNRTDFIENYISQKFNLEYLNHIVKIQKRLNNAYFLMNFVVNNPDTIFQAMILKIKNSESDNTNNKIVSLVIYNITINFKKIFIMKIPFNDNIKILTPFEVKLCYNSSLFKNYIFPFSIVIL